MADTDLVDRPRRTALVVHPDADLFGSGRVLLETVAGLVDHSWQVVLVVPTDGPLAVAVQPLGAEVIVQPFPVLRRGLLRPATLLGARSAMRAVRGVDELLRRVRPDLVIVSTLRTPIWLLRTRARGVPAIAHVHEDELRHPSTLGREALARPLLLADRVIVNSAATRSRLTQVVPGLSSRCAVVDLGVAGPVAGSEPRPTLDGGLRLVCPAPVSRRAGLEVAIAALAELVARGIDAELEIAGEIGAGEEPYVEELRRQAEILGLTGRVRIAASPGIWSALDGADIALVPSGEEEPFGSTAVEAVLAGRPVAVSATGGSAEAFDGFASAVPVQPDDALALAGAIHRISVNWPAFRRSAIVLAPMAAARYAPSRFRERMAAEAELLVADRDPARAMTAR